uniref:Intersectin 2b n=1 Tax=Cynoglossus semilaevis TaxID=244447 RepID=A0A3P8VI77_CYNSE
ITEFETALCGLSVWAVTPEERHKHDQKFDSLSPSMGFVSGEQAKKFFLQSGLPASVLAEIWSLADMNKDGKMDRLEFSIAMKLIKLKLQGTPLPSALPIIMKQPPVAVPILSTPPSTMTNPTYAPGLSPMTGLTPLVHVPTGLSTLIAPTNIRPLMSSIGNPSMPNSTIGILQPISSGSLTPGLPSFGSVCLLTCSSSASSSPSVMSPLLSGPSDWAVPHASRLKYRQQFNGLDKQMTGYLTGTQVRGFLASTLLTQPQLASIWTLADVDKDGKLKAEEFILAMHLVDVAKSGHPLPLTLPTELDKFKANLERGNAELEKRRLALLEAEKREQERRAQKLREEQEKREREAREAEERRRKERERELERQKEEERQREMERKEWERRRQGELQIKKEQEQDVIIRLKAKKRSLEMELEAGNNQRQISDRLRDVQNRKKLQKTELDLMSEAVLYLTCVFVGVGQEFQRKLSQLTPEQHRLREKLTNLSLDNSPG